MLQKAYRYIKRQWTGFNSVACIGNLFCINKIKFKINCFVFKLYLKKSTVLCVDVKITDS